MENFWKRSLNILDCQKCDEIPYQNKRFGEVNSTVLGTTPLY